MLSIKNLQVIKETYKEKMHHIYIYIYKEDSKNYLWFQKMSKISSI